MLTPPPRSGRHHASSNISNARNAAAAPASCGQSGRFRPDSIKSSSARTTVASVPAPGFNCSNATGRVSLSRGSTFTTALASKVSPCLTV